eukprot:scaffold10530_cov140-Skeletonema_marinoi.AAC.2
MGGEGAHGMLIWWMEMLWAARAWEERSSWFALPLLLLCKHKEVRHVSHIFIVSRKISGQRVATSTS